MQNKQEVLQACTVNGFIVKLPAVVLERPLYMEVKNVLEKIGGKWKGGKTQGFEFPHDPKDLLQDVAGGIKRNLPAGTFKESGTNIETCLIIIDKPI